MSIAMALAVAEVAEFVAPAAWDRPRRIPSTLGDFVSASAVASSTERMWHKLIVGLDGVERWDDVPIALQTQLAIEAESASAELLMRFATTERREGQPAIDWSPGVRPVCRRELGVDPVTASLITDASLRVVALAAKRWRDGAPAEGRPPAGEMTSLRLTRMVDRLREEGSAQAVADRRSLPDGLVLPGGHGRRYERHARPKPNSSLLRAALATERERARVFREAEWASLRLQGLGIGEIATIAGVSASTVSETAAVRHAGSLRDFALELLAVDSPNKTKLADELDLDPQRLQRAARRLNEDGGEELNPPPSNTPQPAVWDLRAHSRGLLHEPPKLAELAMGLTPKRADSFGKLLQLVADSAAGRKPTMLFCRDSAPSVQRRAPQELIRTFGGHRH